MSDSYEFALPLAQKLRYTNTFYHQEPKLDIKSIDDTCVQKYDFIISSDVFEHIELPVSIAFENMSKILKDTGVIIFSVPYTLQGETTVEHFRDLYDYSLERSSNGQFSLRNITREGKIQVYEDLVFHGGEGFTIEMRVFSKHSLLKSFYRAGFKRVKFYEECFPQYGIYWNYPPSSVPLSARK